MVRRRYGDPRSPCCERRPKGGKEPGDGSTRKAECLGRSRGGLTTKLHVVCDGNGIPLGAALSPGQTHDSTCFETALDAVLLEHWPQAIAGDKGCSVRRIRAWLESRQIEDVIPYKSNEHPHMFDRELYRRRNVVERLIGWLKECRRVATRGKHFLAMIKLAALRRLVRLSL